MSVRRPVADGRSAWGGVDAVRPGPDDVAAAEAAATRILCAAAQSEAGLRSRLLRRGFDDQTVETTVAAMVARGYVDDSALASSIAAKRSRTGHGRIRVASELRARGVEATAVADALEALDADQERRAALELAQRSTDRRVQVAVSGPRERQRLAGKLQRRGFDGETVAWVLRQLAG